MSSIFFTKQSLSRREVGGIKAQGGEKGEKRLISKEIFRVLAFPPFWLPVGWSDNHGAGGVRRAYREKRTERVQRRGQSREESVA